MQEAHTVEAADESSHAIVPIPGSLRSGQPRTSFWQRINLRGAKAGLNSPTIADRMLARLDALAARLAGTDQRVEQLDQRFTEVWEVEEQLSRLMELHDILVDVRERQGRLDDRLRALDRRLILLALFAGAAAAAGLVAITLALL